MCQTKLDFFFILLHSIELFCFTKSTIECLGSITVCQQSFPKQSREQTTFFTKKIWDTASIDTATSASIFAVTNFFTL